MSDAYTLLYVSFKGTTINNVSEVASDGSVSQACVLDTSANGCPELDELRGLWLQGGDLYVCDGQEGISKILLFDDGTSGPQRTYTRTVATYDATAMPALKHPYGIAMYDGMLFVSAQDSNYVSCYTINSDGFAVPTDPCQYLQGLGGTYPMGGFVGCTNPPAHTGWTSVPKPKGGLGFTDDDTGTGTDDKKRKKHKHSVRGFAIDASSQTLYVADQANDRVTVFDATDGTYLKHIENKDLLGPVGIAVSADSQHVYIGCEAADRVLRYHITSGAIERMGDQVNSPAGIAVDGSKNIYVASRKDYKIKVLYDGKDKFEDLTSAFEDEPECLVLLGG